MECLTFIKSLYSTPKPKETSRRLVPSWKQHENNHDFAQQPLQQHVYPDNSIKTSLYTVVSFIPVNLFGQFKRISNFYFLMTLLLQMIDQIGTNNPMSSIMPLFSIIFITGLKDAIGGSDVNCIT